MNPRTRRLLEAPLLAMLLKMSAPNLAVMLAQSSTGLIETWFVGHLGTDALAGMALVFPGMMLMQMMSAGAMGGGISSAIARALGARRRDAADALVLHALIINVAFGCVFTIVVVALGPTLYRALGARGADLDAAVTYSNVVFGGAVLLWVFNALASVIRGTGNMHVPAYVIIGGVVVLVPVSPCLIFGIGPFPALGIAGGGVALLTYYVVGGAVLAAYILRGHAIVRLRMARLDRSMFFDILRVGGVAVLVTMQTYLTVSFATAVVGRFGAADIAGFGTGSRLEYLLVPMVFGFGGPLVAIVGTCVGAGDRARAVRAAWMGAAVAGVLTEAIGLAAAFWPEAWLGMFGHDPAMLAAGAAYLRMVGPFYGFFGIGLALYFAGQGAGKLFWPLLAGVLRMVVAIGGGLIAVWAGFGLPAVFFALGLGLACFGIVNAAAVAGGVWFRTRKMAGGDMVAATMRQ
jgi:putative MATE family efflux protein